MQRGQTAHLLNHRKPTAMAAKQAIHAPPRRPQIELTLLHPHSPALRIIQKCPSANAAATETKKATKTPTTTSKQTEREGGLWLAVGPYFAIFFAKFRPFFEKKIFAKFSEI
jgi:hypothetical protein